MKKLVFIIAVLFAITAHSQTYSYQTGQPAQQVPSKAKTAKKYYTSVKKTTTALYPVKSLPIRNVVYQYIDTTFPDSENHFPVKGNAGIGTHAPTAALEIKRNAGDGNNKTFC